MELLRMVSDEVLLRAELSTCTHCNTRNQKPGLYTKRYVRSGVAVPCAKLSREGIPTASKTHIRVQSCSTNYGRSSSSRTNSLSLSCTHTTRFATYKRRPHSFVHKRGNLRSALIIYTDPWSRWGSKMNGNPHWIRRFRCVCVGRERERGEETQNHGLSHGVHDVMYGAFALTYALFVCDAACMLPCPCPFPCQWALPPGISVAFVTAFLDHTMLLSCFPVPVPFPVCFHASLGGECGSHAISCLPSPLCFHASLSCSFYASLPLSLSLSAGLFDCVSVRACIQLSCQPCLLSHAVVSYSRVRLTRHRLLSHGVDTRLSLTRHHVRPEMHVCVQGALTFAACFAGGILAQDYKESVKRRPKMSKNPVRWLEHVHTYGPTYHRIHMDPHIIEYIWTHIS
jgi:hypothetical protein